MFDTARIGHEKTNDMRANFHTNFKVFYIFTVVFVKNFYPNAVFCAGKFSRAASACMLGSSFLVRFVGGHHLPACMLGSSLLVRLFLADITCHALSSRPLFGALTVCR